MGGIVSFPGSCPQSSCKKELIDEWVCLSQSWPSRVLLAAVILVFLAVRTPLGSSGRGVPGGIGIPRFLIAPRYRLPKPPKAF